MSYPTIIASIGVGILAAGAIYRYTQIRHYPLGIGYNLFSPDKRYRAYATTCYSVSYFGRRTAFYRFEVEDCQTQQIVAKHQTTPMPADEAEDFSEPCIYWRWDSDTRSVSIALGYRTYWQHEIEALA